MSTERRFSAARVRSNAIFLAVQLVVIIVFASLYARGTSELATPKPLPPLREQPLSFEPRYDYEVVVTDEQLCRVLTRLRPRLYGAETRFGDLEHAFRLWGPAAEFGDEDYLSGEELRRLITDHRRYAKVYGSDAPPVLIDRGSGVGVRVGGGLATSPHVDHLIACLADAGTPLSFPVVTPQRRTTYRAMVEQTLRDFNLNQEEYEWSASVFAQFLPPVKEWWTTEGRKVSFDLLADRLMRERLPRGVCAANHRLSDLVLFLRVDQREGGRILSPATRERIRAFLMNATQRLVEHQHADGFWDQDWADAVPARSERVLDQDHPFDFRIIATGHALEWWAMAPAEFHPPRHVLAKAGQWLVRTVDALSEDEIRRNYTFLSHVGRALSVWRGRRPVDVLQEHALGGFRHQPMTKLAM